MTRYGIESYIAAPLVRQDGSYFGTLCALDPKPAGLTGEHLTLFKLISQLISHQLEGQERAERTEAALAKERSEATARERLMAVLGHDLRTPISAAIMGAEMLVRDQSLSDEGRRVAVAVHASSRRAARMITDLLDYARARLGGGIPIQRAGADLSIVLRKVAEEIRTSLPERSIIISTQGACHGQWDADRCAQVVSNLIQNALEHGEPGRDVQVLLVGTAEEVTLTVTNQARALAEERVEVEHLGLGLSIVEQIVHAHGGSVQASSEDGRVTVQASFPRRQ